MVFLAHFCNDRIFVHINEGLQTTKKHGVVLLAEGGFNILPLSAAHCTSVVPTDAFC